MCGNLSKVSARIVGFVITNGEGMGPPNICPTFPNVSLDESPTPKSAENVAKRSDYLIWWDYFMSIAYIASLRSKDPNTQVGAVIVNEDNRIISMGYNGMPNKCSDDDLPWNRTTTSDPLESKYLYVVHAETNALMNKTSYDCKNCTMFVLLFPCNECAKMIIQAGITKVVYLSDRYKDQTNFQASRRLLEMAQVELVHYVPKQTQIVIDFDMIKQ